MTPAEALQVLARCERDGITDLDRRVAVYGDGVVLHSGPGCQGAHHRREMTLRDMLAEKENNWCDCGGWRGTRGGQLLQRAAETYRNLEREASGETFENWKVISDELTRAVRDDLALRRDDGPIEEFITRGRQAVLVMARRSATRIGTVGLERAIAAQAIVATVTPEEAEMFANWARRQRIAEHGRDIYLGTHERALAEVLGDETRVLVAVGTGGETTGGLDPVHWLHHQGLPKEIALKLWAEQVPHRPTLLHERIGVANGIIRIGRRREIAVATENETDPETLETLKTIWFDRPENWLNLQEALEAARKLAG